MSYHINFSEDFRHKKFRNIEISSDDVVLKPVEQAEPSQKEVVLSKYTSLSRSPSLSVCLSL